MLPLFTSHCNKWKGGKAQFGAVWKAQIIGKGGHRANLNLQYKKDQLERNYKNKNLTQSADQNALT